MQGQNRKAKEEVSEMEGQIWEASSYLVAVFGSLLLWISYGLFGLIARRYRQVFGCSTYSTLVILAPSGLLIYTLFLVFKVTPLLENPALANTVQKIAYAGLLASGVFCLVGVAKFASVLSKVTAKLADPGAAPAPEPIGAGAGRGAKS